MLSRMSCLGVWCGSLAIAASLGAAEKPRLETYVYKRIGDLKIKADVYRYADSRVRPVVVWIHGGALINGHRAGVSGRVREMAFKNGYVLVSLDYRLAPETKLPEIVQDLEDAFGWLRTEGPRRFHVDPDRMAVMGGSAGGYMTLTAGFRIKPRPRVLVSFWGYGDLVGPWLSQPSPHPRHRQAKLDKVEAWKQVSGKPIADSRQRDGNGGAFYQYCRQTGTWPTAVAGWNPHTQAAKFFPYMAVKNVSPEYPPTVLVHGTKDTDVPYEQSVMMARQFDQHGIKYELLRVEDAEHGLAGGDPDKIDQAYRRAFAFAKRYLDSAR